MSSLESELRSFFQADHALGIEFFSAYAENFMSQGLLTSAESQEIRRSFGSVLEGETLLEHLLQGHTHFVRVLENSSSPLRLMFNFTKYTLKPSLKDTIKIMQTSGSLAIAQAKLGFNRSFPLFEQDAYESNSLFSSWLSDYAESLAESSSTLIEFLETLEKFTSSFQEESDKESFFKQLDQSLCTSLSFKECDNIVFPNLQMKFLKEKLYVQFKILIEFVAEFHRQYELIRPWEPHQKNTYGVYHEASLHRIKNKMDLLRGLQLPEHSNLLSWELFRKDLIKTIFLINKGCEEITSIFHKEMDEILKKQEVFGKKYPKDFERSMHVDLLKKGLSIERAEKATKDLIVYFQTHDISAHQILLGEMQKINKDLLSSSLDIVKACEDKKKGFTVQNSTHKKQIMKKLEKASKVFFLFLAWVFIAKCGYKTAPKSNVIEVRPSYQDNK